MDAFWIPVFLWLVLLWGEFSSQPHSSLFLLLSFVLLLVLLHLELHDLDPPGLDVRIFPEE